MEIPEHPLTTNQLDALPLFRPPAPENSIEGRSSHPPVAGRVIFTPIQLTATFIHSRPIPSPDQRAMLSFFPTPAPHPFLSMYEQEV